jgi:hypothetical protein
VVKGVEIMEFDKEYYWVVLCKNRIFHYRQNTSSGHKILLGETDPVSPPPRLESPFSAICDDCGKEYTYRPSEVLRFETEPPRVFLTHPLFR